LVVGDSTIYESQLRSRADAPAHRAAVGMPLLSSVAISDVMTAPPPQIADESADLETLAVAPEQSVDVALDVLVSAGATCVPVIDDHELVGVVGMNEIMAGYQRELRRSLRQLAGTNGKSVLVEAPITEDSPFAGSTVATAPWPAGSFVLSIDRHSQLIVPRPETALQAGDQVAAVVNADGEAELRRRLDGRPA
jgi:CBS domain-containing protein